MVSCSDKYAGRWHCDSHVRGLRDKGDSHDLQQAPFAIHCCLAVLDNNAELTPDENGVLLKKTQDINMLLTLNRDNTGHIEAQLMDESVNITSLFLRRMTLTAIVE